MKRFVFSLLVIFPFVAQAQSLQEYIPTIGPFLFSVIVPFLLGAAFLAIVINSVRFFIIESTNEQGRERAKTYILYSIIAFVFILVFIGLVNLLVGATGLEGNDMPEPDFITDYERGG